MLTDEERARIELDESWRIEIRKKRRNRPGRRKVLWRWLNSPFVIWALSSAVVAILGDRWSVYKERQKTQKENRAAIQRLDNEIAFRFTQVMGHLNEAKTSTDPSSRIDRALDALEILPDPDRGYVFLYPQYERYSLPACVMELQRYLTLEPNGNTQLDPAIKKKLSAPRTYLRTQGSSLDDPAQVARAILADMIDERWKERGFFLEVADGQVSSLSGSGGMSKSPIVRPSPTPDTSDESQKTKP